MLFFHFKYFICYQQIFQDKAVKIQEDCVVGLKVSILPSMIANYPHHNKDTIHEDFAMNMLMLIVLADHSIAALSVVFDAKNNFFQKKYLCILPVILNIVV